MMINKIAKHRVNVDEMDSTKNNDIQGQLTDNLISERSLLDTANTNSNINVNSNSINESPSMDEPSNSDLLAGLEDLSVNNAAFGSNISEN